MILVNSPREANQSKQTAFALFIANAFNDAGRAALYERCCKKHPRSLVYRAYAEAKATPDSQIRKSRPALFFYLIKKYSHERKDNLSR